MPTLDDEARSVLAAYKRGVTPGEARRRENWAAVQKMMDADEAAAPASATASRARPGVWIGIVGLAAAAGVLLGLGLQPRVVSERHEPSGEARQYVEGSTDRTAKAEARAPAGAERARAARDDSPASPPPMEVEPTEAAPTDVQPAAERAPKEPPSTPGSSHRGAQRSKATEPVQPPVDADPLEGVREEARLVQRARAALTRDGAEQALGILATYAEQFPDGALAEEAAVLRLSALCEVGPADRWRRARAAYEAKHATSPLRAHVRDDCFDSP